MILGIDPLGQAVGPLTFRVYGSPVQQSGTQIVPTARGKRGISTGGKGLAGWRAQIAHAAETEARQCGKFDGPLHVSTAFRFPMPKSRPAWLRNLGVTWHAVYPDGDKLTRAVWDSLTAGGLIADDARIASWSGSKVEMADGWHGVEITVRALTPHDLTGRPLT